MTEAPSVTGPATLVVVSITTVVEVNEASIATVVSTAVVATGPPSTASPLDEIDRKIRNPTTTAITERTIASPPATCAGSFRGTRLGTPPLESLEALISTFPPMHRCRFLVFHDAGSPVDAQVDEQEVHRVREPPGVPTTRSTHHGTHQLNTGIAPELLVRECRQASTMCVQTQVWLADDL